MSNRINIFVSLETFLKEFEGLINAAGLFVYGCQYGPQKQIWQLAGGQMHCIARNAGSKLVIFLTAEPFDQQKDGSFYADAYCVHVIEATGGRISAHDLEQLQLRVISKTPDQKIKAFMGKLHRQLKQHTHYGLGVGPGAYGARKFFHTSEAAGRSLWPDFDNKTVPQNIGA